MRLVVWSRLLRVLFQRNSGKLCDRESVRRYARRVGGDLEIGVWGLILGVEVEVEVSE